jgi:hypothetical protein
MAMETLTSTTTPTNGEVPVSQAQPTETSIPNGDAVAAILAAAIGCAVLGLIIPISEALPAFKNALNWYNPVGPLMGKTLVSVIAYFVAWFFLHRAWKDRDVAFSKIWRISLVLMAIGFIGSFPLFYELFTAP